MATATRPLRVVPPLPAFEEVLDAYAPKIHRWAYRYAILGDDVEDREQMARIGLWLAYRTYQPTRQIPFSSWAGLVVKRHFAAAVRGVQRQLRTPPGRVLSWDGVQPGTGLSLADQVASPAPGPESLVLGAMTRDAWWETLSAGLSDREWRVTLYRLDRLPLRQIARRLGISEKSVDNTWERAKRKMRQRLVLDEIR